MESNKYASYLESLGEIITEYALDAKNKSINSKLGDERIFSEGYFSAFHRIVTLMKQHAELYDIAMHEIGMDQLQEKDLF